MPVVRTTFPGSAFNASAIFDNDGLCDNGSVEQEVVRILEHEGVCSEDLSFFNRNGCIGTNLQVCANVTAAKGDGIVSPDGAVPFYREVRLAAPESEAAKIAETRLEAIQNEAPIPTNWADKLWGPVVYRPSEARE